MQNIVAPMLGASNKKIYITLKIKAGTYTYPIDTKPGINYAQTGYVDIGISPPQILGEYKTGEQYNYSTNKVETMTYWKGDTCLGAHVTGYLWGPSQMEYRYCWNSNGTVFSRSRFCKYFNILALQDYFIEEKYININKIEFPISDSDYELLKELYPKSTFIQTSNLDFYTWSGGSDSAKKEKIFIPIGKSNAMVKELTRYGTRLGRDCWFKSWEIYPYQINIEEDIDLLVMV